jgi:diguanylate cyclase (GGDEF)-like protein
MPRIEEISATQSAQEEARSALLARTGFLDLTPDPELDRWTAVLRRALGTAVVALSVSCGERTLVKGLQAGAAGEARTIELSPSDSLERFLAAKVPSADSPDEPHACLASPVIVNGHELCRLNVADAPTRAWSGRDVMTLQNASAALALEIRLRLAKYEAQRSHQLVVSHNRVHELIAEGAPLEEVLVELVEGIERHEPSVMECVVLLNRESNTLSPGAGPSLPSHYLAAIDGVVIGPNVGSCGSAAWWGQPTITEDIAEDPKWAPIREFAIDSGLRHCWSMPIKSSAGEVLGTLALYGPRARRPLSEHLTLMEDGARLAGIAIERHRALERLTHDARHDGLTGLPNRTAIFELLDEAIVRNQPGAAVGVLFVDLDGLKTLNDTLGHDRADEMIREIGERLCTAVRGSDFVGRFGGDEFVVVTEGINHEEQASHLGFRLLEAISQPLPGFDSPVVTASIGIALVRGTGADAREAIRQADSAMYQAKRSGRDRVVFCDGSANTQVGRRLSLSRELRGADARGELRIVFQPVFELSSGELAAVEALLRWHSPTLGQVSPGEFIPVAEDTGAIMPIGAWVLRESCETLHRIAEQAGRPVELAVNVSAHQVAHPGFARSVVQTLAHAELPATQLTLEITETALMRPDAVTARTLRELESHGIRIVLDDFGTGFSSLSWLKEHPVGAIKIDRSFVDGLAEDPRDQAIVAALIGMSRTLGVTVTAEGVETEEQLDALRALDCERVQGFLLARPLPAHELGPLLARAQPGAIATTQLTAATTAPAGLHPRARTRHRPGRAPAPSGHPEAPRHRADR